MMTRKGHERDTIDDTKKRPDGSDTARPFAFFSRTDIRARQAAPPNSAGTLATAASTSSLNRGYIPYHDTATERIL